MRPGELRLEAKDLAVRGGARKAVLPSALESDGSSSTVPGSRMWSGMADPERESWRHARASDAWQQTVSDVRLGSVFFEGMGEFQVMETNIRQNFENMMQIV